MMFSCNSKNTASVLCQVNAVFIVQKYFHITSLVQIGIILSCEDAEKHILEERPI